MIDFDTLADSSGFTLGDIVKYNSRKMDYYSELPVSEKRRGIVVGIELVIKEFEYEEYKDEFSDEEEAALIKAVHILQNRKHPHLVEVQEEPPPGSITELWNWNITISWEPDPRGDREHGGFKEVLIQKELMPDFSTESDYKFIERRRAAGLEVIIPAEKVFVVFPRLAIFKKLDPNRWKNIWLRFTLYGGWLELRKRLLRTM